MDTDTIGSIARGYAVAALFTAGVDSAPGEYQPDESKVADLMPHARVAASAFVHIAGEVWIDESGVDLDRIGNCLHYDREGHGTGFADEGDSYPLQRLENVARRMGEDDELSAQLTDRYPDAFAG